MVNISRSKGSQAKEFGQLTEDNMRNILWKNLTQNMVENYNQNNEHISGSILEDLIQFAFTVSQVKDY